MSFLRIALGVYAGAGSLGLAVATSSHPWRTLGWYSAAFWTWALLLALLPRWRAWRDRRRLRREWRELNARSLSTITRPLPDARPAQPDRRY